MALIALKAWYLPHYEPIQDVIQRPYDLRLSRSSLLKSGLRADFLDEPEEVRGAPWFQRYLEGAAVEFYIEGSGGYVVANVDLISHEIYFTKLDLTAWLEPTIFLSYQTQVQAAADPLRSVLTEAIAALNPRSRLPLSLVESPRPNKGPWRLSDTQLRRIRKCLLFVGDCTPIATTESVDLPSPEVSVEIGYALPNKRPGQILLVYLERKGAPVSLPYDLPQHQELGFNGEKELSRTLPQLVEALLGRFNLFN